MGVRASNSDFSRIIFLITVGPITISGMRVNQLHLVEGQISGSAALSSEKLYIKADSNRSGGGGAGKGGMLDLELAVAGIEEALNLEKRAAAGPSSDGRGSTDRGRGGGATDATMTHGLVGPASPPHAIAPLSEVASPAPSESGGPLVPCSPEGAQPPSDTDDCSPGLSADPLMERRVPPAAGPGTSAPPRPATAEQDDSGDSHLLLRCGPLALTADVYDNGAEFHMQVTWWSGRRKHSA